MWRLIRVDNRDSLNQIAAGLACENSRMRKFWHFSIDSTAGIRFASSKRPWTYRDLQKNWNRTGDTCFLVQVCWIVEVRHRVEFWSFRFFRALLGVSGGLVGNQLPFCKVVDWLRSLLSFLEIFLEPPKCACVFLSELPFDTVINLIQPPLVSIFHKLLRSSWSPWPFQTPLYDP
jgi:hypothetical protein